MPRGGMPGPELLADGLPVVAPAVPNRSLLGDAAYVASVIRQIDGPVILVGHSYGGAVITVAGIEPNVRALVYLSAYALEEGESSDQPGTDVYVDVAKFPGIFAADVDPELARVLAAGQRPLAGVAFTTSSGSATSAPG
jgi:pimeloyl-ACP methyl ester carboxylesterase